MNTLYPSKTVARRAGALGLATIALSLALSGCAVPVTRTAWVDSAPQAAAAPVAPVATRGTVENIEEMQTHLEPTGGGAVLGALAGGLIGSRFGGGLGRAVATGAGVVGGAVIGNTIEHNQAAAAGAPTVYRVTVRMDDGTQRSIEFHDLTGLRVGERVHFTNGVLVRG
jgi:outer membrane lipoprotein SlyB